MATGSSPSTNNGHRRSVIVGTVWILFASLCFATAWMFVKLASAELHPFVIAVWRSVLGAALLLPWLVRGGVLHLDRIGGHALRATSGVIAVLGTFYALANAPLSAVQAINFAAPIFATIGAALFLGERLRRRRLMALGVGFVGVLVVLRPGEAALTPGIGAAIVGALAIAFSIVAIKRLVERDSPLAVTAWSFILAIPPTAIAAAFVWDWPTGETWLYLAGLGLSSLGAQLAVVRAFALAETTAVMPYDFVRFGIIIAIGVLIFGEPVDLWTLGGGGIILVSTLYLAFREAALARRGPASLPRAG